MQRWSLDIQRGLGKSVVASIGYVGSAGTKLTTQYDLNLPTQGTYFDYYGDYLDARPLSSVAPGRWGAIWGVHHNRSNNYHAMNLQLKTQNWHNLTSIVNYTWSKQMDTFFGESGESGIQLLGGQWHPEWSYGPSDSNHTNRFVAAVTYELPGRNMSNRLLREGIGGWQLSTIATFESGAPVTVVNGYTSSYDFMGDVPDVTCNGNLSRGGRIRVVFGITTSPRRKAERESAISNPIVDIMENGTARGRRTSMSPLLVSEVRARQAELRRQVRPNDGTEMYLGSLDDLEHRPTLPAGSVIPQTLCYLVHLPPRRIYL